MGNVGLVQGRRKMLAAVGMNFRGLLFLAASLAFAGPAMAQNFTYPQGVYNGAKPELGTYANGGVVNAALLERAGLTQPVEPYTVELTKGVWALVGYHWGYTALIEGETSLILYDTADDVEEGREIIELARKVSDKPIRTIIYSHSHYVWGAQAIADAYGDDITVIGDPGINKSLLESGGLGSSIPELAPVLLARTLEQFSFLLPESGPDARSPTPIGKTKGFVPVNKGVKNGESLTIDGVEMVFYTGYESDAADNVIVYLPQKKTVLNNFLWPVFPNIYTLRGSEYRDPTSWAAGIKLIRDLQPEYLFNTHAIPTFGKENIARTLNSYFDAIMYLYDQTIRGILLGKTPDELRYWVQMPKDLAALPNNQMSYGELSYFPPYIYQAAIGWFGRDAENLNPVSPDEQAKRIVEGFGGADEVKAQLRTAIEASDLAWGAELGGYLIKYAPEDSEARGLLAKVLRQMAYNTEATIPRSWYLTKALALEGKIQIPTVMFQGPESVLGSAPATFVNQYRVRLDPKVSYGQDQMLAITLSGTDAPTMGLHVRSGVAEFVPDTGKYARKADASIDMSMEAWGGYYVGDITLDDLLGRSDVTVGDKAQVKAFFAMFDQVHPSKTALVPASATKK